MNDVSQSASDDTSRFFSNYPKCLHKDSLPERQRRWYVRRPVEFIRAHSGQKIKGRSAAHVVSYFEMIGRQVRLNGWQFGQCVSAIKILYCELFANSLCREVDWLFWLDSVRQLEVDHPTTVRLFTPRGVALHQAASQRWTNPPGVRIVVASPELVKA